MKIALDVQYGDPISRVAGVLFQDWNDAVPHAEYTLEVTNIAPYDSGSFYLREMPCLIALLAKVVEPIDLIIVDCFVDLEPGHPGTGRRLYEFFDRKIPVIGVAKTQYVNAQAQAISRHGTKVLYVGAAGVDSLAAAVDILKMHGPYRIPTLLKRADSLARKA